ncbi:MAG: ABC transporter ATP-binding protein, partial [Planctomycetaceae bacterium]|nr:ABC transporter ATP-binding protein [Planctomycetaceae bacterium]
KTVPPQNKPAETTREVPREIPREVNRRSNASQKLSFERIDELTRPPTYSVQTADKVKTSEKVFEAEAGLGTKFVLRSNQETSVSEIQPKQFDLHLPEWPQIPEILAAAKDENEHEKQRSRWQEALYRCENQYQQQQNNPIENTAEDNTQYDTEEEYDECEEEVTAQVIPMSDFSEAAASRELPEILSAKGLTKSYKKGKLTIPVLCGVDFAVGTGEFVSVAGQSGSGKSTFLHLLGTLDKPDSGSIYLEGQRIDNLPRRNRDRIRNRSIGFIFQFYHLLPELTTLENVLSPLMIRENIWGYFTKRKAYIEQGKDILHLVGLSHRLSHKPSELSGGEMQRAAIARALVASPAVLLADEPTGNLDSKSAGEIIEILQQLNQEQGLTIVMITHDSIIAKAADRIVKMVDGKILA